MSSKTGVPSLQVTGWYWSLACEEPGHTTGDERQASEQSFICVYSCSHHSRYHLSSASCQISFWKINSGLPLILIMMSCIIISCISQFNNNGNKVHNKCNVLSHPQTTSHPPVPGKIVFHKVGPWCQKGWELLLYGQVILSPICMLPAF